MAGELHEVSRSIGALEEGISGLKDAQSRGNDLFDQHCKDDDDRHRENIATMREIMEEIKGLRQAVESMQPIVEGYQVTRSRLAAWASIGITIFAVLGWILEAGVKWLVNLILTKFGG